MGLELVKVFVNDRYENVLEFCRAGSIKTIVFYNLSSIGGDVVESLEMMKRMLEEGVNVMFAGADFLNYISELTLKRKVVEVPWYKIHELFLERYAEVYKRFPQAPRSYQSIVGAVKRIMEKRRQESGKEP